jgi:protein TonB
VKSWVASLALHGAVVGAAAMLWLEPPAEQPAAILHWDVALVAPDPEPVARETPPVPHPARPDPVRPPSVPVPDDRPKTKPAPPEPEPSVIETAVAAPQATAESAPAPVTRPEPVAQADAAVQADAIERRWYLVLMERLRAMKRYPMVARRLGQEGVVLVEARIGRDGQLEGLKLKRGSGFPLLDNEALRLIEAATEAVRGELHPERPARLEIPVAYKLDG